MSEQTRKRWAIINGRRVELPEVADAEQIARAGHIDEERVILRRTREGNYPVAPGTRVRLDDGDYFVDAPQRTKGVGSPGT